MDARLASLLLVVLATIVAPCASQTATVLSVTAIDESTQNYMLLFNATNATNPTLKVNFPYQEPIAGALDTVRGRYLLLLESLQIATYDVSTLEQLQLINLPPQVSQIIAMFYDSKKDLLWLIEWDGNGNVHYCTLKGSQHNCVAQAAGPFSFATDGALYDPSSGYIYVQLANLNSGQEFLYIFDTSLNVIKSPLITIPDSCNGMQIVDQQLVCVPFSSGALATVHIDYDQAVYVPISNLPGGYSPYTAVYDSRTGTYYCNTLSGDDEQSLWVGVRVNTGSIMTVSSVNSNLPLAMSVLL